MTDAVQLHDILEPTSISAWPLALGWWTLAGLAALCLLLMLLALWQRWKRRQLQRPLLVQLAKHGDQLNLRQAASLLKLAAMMQLGRQRCAGLYGAPLYEFLCQQFEGKAVTALAQLTRLFDDQRFAADGNLICSATERSALRCWIKTTVIGGRR